MVFQAVLTKLCATVHASLDLLVLNDAAIVLSARHPKIAKVPAQFVCRNYAQGLQEKMCRQPFRKVSREPTAISRPVLSMRKCRLPQATKSKVQAVALREYCSDQKISS